MKVLFANCQIKIENHVWFGFHDEQTYNRTIKGKSTISNIDLSFNT
jgi:hypothetical protein